MSKHAAFTFGRFNPPTLGHKLLVDKVVQSANGGEYYIFASQTKDNDKNPLEYSTKIQFLRLIFPQHAAHIIQDLKIKTVLNAADYLEGLGVTDATFVCGSDRIDDFTKLLNKWNEIHRNAGKGFRTFNMVSSGAREEGADGVAGISASLARKYAKENNLEAFKAIVPHDVKLATEIFTTLRKEMGMNEIKKHIRGIISEILMEQDLPDKDKGKITSLRKKTATDKVKEKQGIEKSLTGDLKIKKDLMKVAIRDRSPEGKVNFDKAKEDVENAKKSVDNAKKMSASSKLELGSIK